MSVASFSLVVSITPGPNNVLLTTCGARLGYRGSLPSVFGILTGMGALIIVCGGGVGLLVSELPGVRLALSVAASAYMLWLAFRLWRAAGGVGAEGEEAFPAGWWPFTAFQFVNPKAWLAGIAFAAAFLGAGHGGGPWYDAVAVATFLAVAGASCSAWVLFGVALRARMEPQHWQRLNRTLGVLAGLTVITFWT